MPSLGQPPSGCHSVTPRLVVDEVEAQVEFLRAALATGEVSAGRPAEVSAGRPAEVRIGDSLVVVSPSSERERFPAFLYGHVGMPTRCTPGVGSERRTSKRRVTFHTATSVRQLPQMVDRLFSDPALAERYDLLCEGRPDFAFYLPLVLSADAVLDVGCGTGELLRLARQRGHRGRLCGLDPAEAMLVQARRCGGVEWVLGDLGAAAWDRDFDLVVMTGHAFQVLLDDDELEVALAGVRAALTSGGRFVFETRNPLVRAWESWTPDHEGRFVGSDGFVLRVRRQVESVDGDRVRFTQTFTSPAWDRERVSWSTLRFLTADAVSSFVGRAGLVVEEQAGDWDRRPFDDNSPEIITVARRP